MIGQNYDLNLRRIDDTQQEWTLTILSTRLKVDTCYKCGKQFEADEKIYFCKETERIYCYDCEHKNIFRCQSQNGHVHFFCKVEHKEMLNQLKVMLLFLIAFITRWFK